MSSARKVLATDMFRFEKNTEFDEEINRILNISANIYPPGIRPYGKKPHHPKFVGLKSK